jgi:hypothetical protein
MKKQAESNPMYEPKSRTERRKMARELSKQTGDSPKPIYAALKRMEESRT